jgi:hypothetical protein
METKKRAGPYQPATHQTRVGDRCQYYRAEHGDSASLNLQAGEM